MGLRQHLGRPPVQHPAQGEGDGIGAALAPALDGPYVHGHPAASGVPDGGTAVAGIGAVIHLVLQAIDDAVIRHAIVPAHLAQIGGPRLGGQMPAAGAQLQGLMPGHGRSADRELPALPEQLLHLLGPNAGDGGVEPVVLAGPDEVRPPAVEPALAAQLRGRVGVEVHGVAGLATRIARQHMAGGQCELQVWRLALYQQAAQAADCSAALAVLAAYPRGLQSAAPAALAAHRHAAAVQWVQQIVGHGRGRARGGQAQAELVRPVRGLDGAAHLQQMGERVFMQADAAGQFGGVRGAGHELAQLVADAQQCGRDVHGDRLLSSQKSQFSFLQAPANTPCSVASPGAIWPVGLWLSDCWHCLMRLAMVLGSASAFSPPRPSSTAAGSVV